MFFFCKDVHVHNHQYHYNYSGKYTIKNIQKPSNNNKSVKTKTKTIPRISSTLTSAGNLASSSQLAKNSLEGSEDCFQLTLLEKLRRQKDKEKDKEKEKGEFLETCLSGTNKGNNIINSNTNTKIYNCTNFPTIDTEISKILTNKIPQPTLSTNPTNATKPNLQPQLSQPCYQTTIIAASQSQPYSFCLPFQKQLIISQQVHQNSLLLEQNHNNVNIIQQSVIIEPTINDKFINIYCLRFDQESECQEQLAIDTSVGAIVSLKFLCGKGKHKNDFKGNNIYRQLDIYNRIQWHPNIVSLYQICCHKGKQVLIRQPYKYINNNILTTTTIASISTPTLANPSFAKNKLSKVAKASLCRDIKQALQYLQKKQIQIGYVKIEDICQCSGVWKLSNFPPPVFEEKNGCVRIPVEKNIQQLMKQIQRQ